jgi:hypothetical protein
MPKPPTPPPPPPADVEKAKVQRQVEALPYATEAVTTRSAYRIAAPRNAWRASGSRASTSPVAKSGIT